MREIVTRFENNCRKCGKLLGIGSKVIYEKRIGIFCIGCAPTDPEEIREFRLEAAEKKASKYEEWAAKRKEKANAILNHDRTHYLDDLAFVTQPGHIPFRDRIINRDDKAMKSLRIAADMEAKAERLRHVRVAGDAERKYEERREKIRNLLKPGVSVKDPALGRGVVLKINKKSVKVQFQFAAHNVDAAWLQIIDGNEK